jgi:hypothetical protein
LVNVRGLTVVYTCKFLFENIFFLVALEAERVEYLGVIEYISGSKIRGRITLGWTLNEQFKCVGFVITSRMGWGLRRFDYIIESSIEGLDGFV